MSVNSKIAQNIAAGIAQELRTPVFAIASAAQLLRYRVTDDPVIEINIGRILREAERLNALVSALIEYGRPEPVRLSPGDPDRVWAETVASLRGVLESRALLVRHAPATPRATCNLDEVQLGHALSNAIANAIDAAPEGSDLTITSTAANGTWESRLHNDGPSVAPEVLTRAFEPLVTTKPGHAGIGLAVAHRILTDHGGAISFHNVDRADGHADSGCTLTFRLPAVRLP